MKKIIMSVIALAVISMTIGFVGCNKEKDTINENQNENVERKPIASINLATGETSYFFDQNSIQRAIDNQYMTKDGTERYVIETVEIEKSFEDSDTVFSALKIVILDTEKELSETHWLFGGFLETVMQNGFKDYYLSKDVCSKNYSFVTGGKNSQKVEVKNGKIESIEDVDSGLEYGPLLPWDVSCQTVKCPTGCRKKFYGVPNGWICECIYGGNTQNSRCETNEAHTTVAIIGVIVTIVALL